MTADAVDLSWQIVAARPGQEVALAELHLRTVTTAYAHIFPPTAAVPREARLVADWARMLATPGVEVFVAVDDGPLIGSIVARPDPDDPTAGEIARLHVDPDHWARGVGRRLVDAAIDAHRRAGRRSVGLWVLEGNHRARAVYERLGWTLDPRRTLDWHDLGVIEVRYTIPIAGPPDQPPAGTPG